LEASAMKIQGTISLVDTARNRAQVRTRESPFGG
jgi:hypothetical protein